MVVVPQQTIQALFICFESNDSRGGITTLFAVVSAAVGGSIVDTLKQKFSLAFARFAKSFNSAITNNMVSFINGRIFKKFFPYYHLDHPYD